jgi:protein TonB
MLSAQPQRTPPEQPPQLDVPLKGFQTIVVPAVTPTAIPPVDLREHFDPRDYSGTGVEGGRGTGITPGDDAIYSESAVEEAPTLLSAAPLVYPPLLRQAGIHGTVVVQAVVDTAGRVVPASIKIVRTPHPGFEASARQWVLSALFRPARIQGRPVRVLVNQPLNYAIGTQAGR